MKIENEKVEIFHLNSVTIKILSRIQKKQSRKIVIPENGQNNKQQQNKMKNEKQINFKFVNK